MKLIESDSRLSEVCRAVEVHVRNVSDLATLELSVVLLADFDSLPGAEFRGIRLSPTAYQPEERRILVNCARFFSLPRDVSEAVLGHEIGHAVCHRDSVMQREPRYRHLSECIVADLLACKWSFFEGLRRERLESNGPRYCEILKLWPNKGEFVRSMTIWCQQRLAGIK